jgi:hypothetical protein
LLTATKKVVGACKSQLKIANSLCLDKQSSGFIIEQNLFFSYKTTLIVEAYKFFVFGTNNAPLTLVTI